MILELQKPLTTMIKPQPENPPISRPIRDAGDANKISSKLINLFF